MLEIRFHGRGGQGTVLAVKILADAVLRSGRGECMAIPEFGVERRGAPVVAYARISESRIRLRSRIYEPDAVVLLDAALAGTIDVTRGLKPGGTLIVNSEEEPAALAQRWPGLKVRPVPARGIALANRLGSPASPVVNTAMCGGTVAVLDLADLAALETAVREAVPDHVEANVAAAQQAFRVCLEMIHAPA